MRMRAAGAGGLTVRAPRAIQFHQGYGGECFLDDGFTFESTEVLREMGKCIASAMLRK